MKTLFSILILLSISFNAHSTYFIHTEVGIKFCNILENSIKKKALGYVNLNVNNEDVNPKKIEEGSYYIIQEMANQTAVFRQMCFDSIIK